MPNLLDEMACFVLKLLTSEIPCYAETATCEDLLRSETADVRSTLLDTETATCEDLLRAETADIRSTLLYAETATCEDLLRSETDDAQNPARWRNCCMR